MKKSSVLLLCVLLSWISVAVSCDDWQQCSKFKKKKTRKVWNNCHCNADNNKPDPVKPTPTPPINDEVPVEDESCKPYNPTMPNLGRPGQRISVTKCHEYLWEIKVRIERSERERKCRESKALKRVFKREEPSDEKPEKGFNHPIAGKPSLFIMGGHDAFPKEFPHMGAVGFLSSDPNRKYKFMCGSTLISAKFALTAAHCSSADSRDTTISDIVPKIVRFGVEDIVNLIEGDHSAVDRNILKIHVHPQYKSPIKYYDMALFELDKPITFNKFIQPACLWTEDTTRVKNGTVTGWGVTNPDAHEGHPYLQAADLDVIDDKTCEEYLWSYHNRRWRGLEEHQFCAGQMAGGVDSCQGDSGGPFQTKIPLPPQVAWREGNMHHIVGVTSFGISCGKKELPGIYSKVSKFLDWIEPIVWPS
ncbi:trypsin domain-containing protein [Phthorimaea operculella]|nr:trypsin domain-containing protein [Phthorimaea operculella]